MQMDLFIESEVLKYNKKIEVDLKSTIAFIK